MKVKKIIVTDIDTVAIKIVDENLAVDKPTEVVIANKYSHISSGTELACLAGLEDWFKFPATPGYTSIGEVIEAGSECGFAIGQLVYTFGAHQSHFKIDVTDRWHGVAVPLPAGINQKHAAFTHMAGIAITALRKSKIELGDWVAVTGLGTIGNLAAQLAQLQGANVIGLDINSSRIEIAKKCGISNSLNSKDADMNAMIETINGGKVSTFIDATGVPAVIEKAACAINLYGELILLGSPRANYNTNLSNFLQNIHLWSHGSIEVKGALEFTYPTQPFEHVKHSITRNSEIILDLIHREKLKIDPLHTHTVKPEAAPEIYKSIKNDLDHFIGVLFDWT